MRVFLIATAFAAASFVAHWLWWRVRIPRRQTAALLALFSIVLIVGLVITTGFVPAVPAVCRLENIWEVLHVAGTHVAIMLAYVVAYSAIEERSPSMTILSKVAKAGPEGVSRTDLESLLKTTSPVEIRIAAMLRDGMVRNRDGQLVLTAKGVGWASVFSNLRKFLCFTKGG
jgi:hypothetical protein